MIKIFNRKINSEIIINENVSWIQFTPKHYEEKPYVTIEMKGFNFVQHSNSCIDCKTFIESFGQESYDWYISYSNKIFLLNTKDIGGISYPSNKIVVTSSEYNSGTSLTLIIHELPVEKDKLEILLLEAVANENYEKACVLRDLIENNQFVIPNYLLFPPTTTTISPFGAFASKCFNTSSAVPRTVSSCSLDNSRETETGRSAPKY
jgi:hypothetical protein